MNLFRKVLSQLKKLMDEKELEFEKAKENLNKYISVSYFLYQIKSFQN